MAENKNKCKKKQRGRMSDSERSIRHARTRCRNLMRHLQSKGGKHLEPDHEAKRMLRQYAPLAGAIQYVKDAKALIGNF